MTYVGAIGYSAQRRVWRVSCQPHVMIRLRRLFGRVPKVGPTVEILDTLDAARDLAWFTDRYPLKGSPATLMRLRTRAAEHVERGEMVARIVSDGYTPRDFPLALPAREYQRVAAELALRTGGLLVADDLGTGKTVTAICVLTDRRALPALVVCPVPLQTQWRAQLARFAPGLRVHIAKKGTPYPLDSGPSLPGLSGWPDVLVISYAKLAGWAGTLAGQVKGVVFDEAQELRRPDSDKYAAAEQVARAAEIRVGLTATPIYNYGSEIFPVLSVLRPGALGSADEFTREWCGGAGGRAVREPKALGTYLRDEGLMLRRTRAEVGRELPPLTKTVHTIDADPEALRQVEGSATELARVLLTRGGLERGEKLRAAEELSYVLRQATGIAKAPYVAAFVRLLAESGEKVLLLGWHRAVYDLWLQQLCDLRPVLYTGSESPTQKDAAKAAFLDSSPSGARVLIMSLRSGAGLDGLQAVCRTVVHGELDWSPGVHEQCDGRPHRDGQTDPVASYYLVADSGSDPVVADVLGLKRSQIEGLRDPGGALIERLAADGSHVQRLAAAYLQQRGLSLPQTEVAA